MPTKRPPLTVTETPVLARRLELAGARFPELAGSRVALLLRLTEIAEETLRGEAARSATSCAEAKRRVLERTQGITPDQSEAMLAAREIDWQRDPGR
jgi:hypothetical protein